MDAIDVGGANLILTTSDGWGRVNVEVSLDARRLVCIYQARNGFRVQRHFRGKMEHQWQGDWWLEHGAASITDTLESAQSLAASYLGSAV